MNPGEACKDIPSKNYQVTWQITCDEKGEKGKHKITNEDDFKGKHDSLTKNCDEIIIKATSIHGCTLSNYYAVSAFIRANKVIFCIIFLVIGLFLNFLGAKISSITLVITAFLSTIIGIFMIVFGIFNTQQVKTGIMWVILVCAIMIGFFVAFLFYKMKKVFYAVLGGSTGLMVGVFLYNFIFRYINSNPLVVYWLVIVACVILGVLFAIYLEKHLLIISTTIVGAYFVIRGASFVIGAFPAESEVIDMIRRKEYDQLSKVSLIFLILF